MDQIRFMNLGSVFFSGYLAMRWKTGILTSRARIRTRLPSKEIVVHTSRIRYNAGKGGGLTLTESIYATPKGYTVGACTAMNVNHMQSMLNHGFPEAADKQKSSRGVQTGRPHKEQAMHNPIMYICSTSFVRSKSPHATCVTATWTVDRFMTAHVNGSCP